MSQVLVTSAPFNREKGVAGLMDYIQSKGWNVVDATDRKSSMLEITAAETSIDGLVLGLQHIGPAECTALKAKGCHFVSRDGVGVDNIDHFAAKEFGIMVSKTAGANCLAVAEQTLGLLLAVRRNIASSNQELKAGGWRSTYGSDLDNTNFGIFGLGHVGREVVQRAVFGFNMHVLAYDPADTPEISEFCCVMPSRISTGGFRGSFQRASCEEQILAWSDHVSLNMELQSPGEPSNAGFFDRKKIAQCHNSAVLINTARGGLVVEADLIEALKSGRLSAAGLDVFEEEPLASDSPFRSMSNVVLTPHTASKSMPARFNQGRMAVDNLASMFTTGKPLVGNLVTLPS